MHYINLNILKNFTVIFLLNITLFSFTALSYAQEYDRKFVNLIRNNTSPPIIRKDISRIFSDAEKLAKNNTEKAFSLLAQLQDQELTSDEKTKLYYVQGKIHSLQSNYLESIKAYEKTLKRKSIYFSLHSTTIYMLGKQSYLIKDYEKVIKYFNKMLILNKKVSANIYFMLGEAYFYSSNNALAKEYLRLARSNRSKDKALRTKIKKALKKVTLRIKEIEENTDGSPDLPPKAKLTYWPLLKVAPRYPRKAARNDIEGHVFLIFDISRTGYPINIRVKESSNPLFNTPAVNSAKKYKYLLSEKIDQKIFAHNILHKITFELNWAQ